jgi:hypothetical protein
MNGRRTFDSDGVKRDNIADPTDTQEAGCSFGAILAGSLRQGLLTSARVYV